MQLQGMPTNGHGEIIYFVIQAKHCFETLRALARMGEFELIER